MPTYNSVPIPAGSLTDDAIASAAAIAATKVVQEITGKAAQNGGADVAAATTPIHAAYKAGTVVGFRVAILTAPTGGDKAFTVDLKKSTGGGAFASILSAVVTIDSSKANNTTYSATISSGSYSAGDILQVVVAASGSTGSQGQGVIAEAILHEAAQ
jgi:hypothetical protein